jgi:hypothetical protein
MTNWAERIDQLIEQKKMVQIEKGHWRLLSLGPTKNNHVLFEYKPGMWKHVLPTDITILTSFAAGTIYQIYPDVWKRK